MLQVILSPLIGSVLSPIARGLGPKARAGLSHKPVFLVLQNLLSILVIIRDFLVPYALEPLRTPS